MEMQRPPGMSMEKWALTKSVVMVGWMAYLRVSEIVGSGMERGQPKEGPSRLDVCDAVFVEEPGSRGRLDLRLRSAKNDQEGTGETTVVYEDELGEGLCAIKKLKTWMAMAHLEVQKGCTKGAPGSKQCCRRDCACDCKVCGKVFRGVAHGKVRDAGQAAVEAGAQWNAEGAVP